MTFASKTTRAVLVVEVVVAVREVDLGSGRIAVFKSRGAEYVRSHCRFQKQRHRVYVRESGIKRARGGTERRRGAEPEADRDRSARAVPHLFSHRPPSR
jgi:hypothetical protein